MLIAPRNTLSHTQIKFYSKYLDNVLWSRHLKFIITSMCGGFLVAQIVKTLPEMQEIQVWSLGQEDPLEKGMRTHSSILAWRIPRTEKPGGLQSVGSQRVGHDWETKHSTVLLAVQFLKNMPVQLHMHTCWRMKDTFLKRALLWIEFCSLKVICCFLPC